MRLEEWLNFYSRICKDLAIDEKKDAESALELSKILGSHSNRSLLEQFRGGDFCVVGNGPDLAVALDKMGEGTTVVADSALTVFLEHRGVPDIVVTDLDGEIDSLQKAYEGGSLMILHAHGDNISLIQDHAEKFRGRAVGTTQGIPLWNVFNFSGFTDGDRGAFLADYLEADNISLVGFDFETVGYKLGTDRKRKKIKLKWAKVLLEELAKERGTKLVEGPIIPL